MHHVRREQAVVDETGCAAEHLGYGGGVVEGAVVVADHAAVGAAGNVPER